MTYLITFYGISAVLAALCLLPYVDQFFTIARNSSSANTNQSVDRATVLICMLLIIVVPVINTLFVLHAIDCFFRYPEAN